MGDILPTLAERCQETRLDVTVRIELLADKISYRIDWPVVPWNRDRDLVDKMFVSGVGDTPEVALERAKKKAIEMRGKEKE